MLITGRLILVIFFIFSSVAESKPVNNNDQFSWMEKNSNSLKEWFDIRSNESKNYLNNLSLSRYINTKFDYLDKLDNELPVTDFNFSKNEVFYLKWPNNEDGNKLFLKNKIGKEKLIIDPPNGYTIGNYMPSNNGKYVAYGLYKNSGESGTIKVIDVTSGNILSDNISNIKFPKIMWNKDNKSFFYTKQYFDSVEEKQTYGEVYLHKVGSKSDSDTLIFSRKNVKDFNRSKYPSITISLNSNWAIVSVGANIDGYGLDFFATKYEKLNENSKWIKILNSNEKYIDFVIDKNCIYLVKENASSGYTIFRLDLEQPEQKKEKIYEWNNGPFTQFKKTKSALYVTYYENMNQKFIRIPFDDISNIQKIKLFSESKISALFTNNEQKNLLFTIQDWLIPPSVYLYNENKNTITHYLYDIKNTIFTGKYETEVRMVPSKDNVLVPLTLIHKKGQKLDGSSPTWLTAYGSYGVSLLPRFSKSNIVWLEMGGIIAIAHVRGGGELGPSWHDGGKGENKINSITDFIIAAEYLINKDYTNPSKLFISGRSAGGIIIGMAVAKKPNLFSAVAIDAGILNTSKLDKIPIGIMNYEEFGSPLSKQGRKLLEKIDTYLNLKYGVKYPAMMLTVGLEDERVSIWQTAKLAAKLEKINNKISEKNSILVLSYENTGHFFGNDSFIIKFFKSNIL